VRERERADHVEEAGEAPAAGAVVALLRRPPVQCRADEVLVRHGDGGLCVHYHRVAAGARGDGGRPAKPEQGPDEEPNHLEQQPGRHFSASNKPRARAGHTNKCSGKGNVPSLWASPSGERGKALAAYTM
jgi:hypothetical protein